MAETATVPASVTVPPATPSGEIKTPDVPVSKEQIFKINGQDWPESKLAQRIQKAEGLEKRVADADRYEKAFNNFAAQVDDPAQFVGLLNSPQFKYDEDKQAALLKSMLETKKPKLVQAVKQWLYENEVEPSTLTDEQRKMRQLEKDNQKFKTEAQRLADQQKAAELASESQKIWNDYRIKIGAGLKAEGLPETEMMVARIARKAMLMRKAGQPADIGSAVKSVRTELQAEYMSNLDKASATELLNLLPESILKKINAAYVTQLKKSQKAEEKQEPTGHPFKRKTKQEATSKENKDFWKNVSRGMFPA